MSDDTPLGDAYDHLRDAIARVASAFRGKEEVDVVGPRWRELERQVDEALASGDGERARNAVALWLRFALGEVRRRR